MRIVLFNWRDRKHPRAGGAELYTHEALSALARRGHECTWFTSSSPQSADQERAENYTVIRRGTELTCRLHAYKWLRRQIDKFDLVIDEVNTLPWASPLIDGMKTILLIHQLAREVWWAEAPPGVSLVGYAMEPALLRPYRNSEVITVSPSSAESLREIGLRGRINIVENPLEPSTCLQIKSSPGLIGYVGRVTRSKRVDHIIRAFAIASNHEQKARLVIVGGGDPREFERLSTLANKLGVGNRVQFTGRVSEQMRDDVMAKMDLLALASLREGWGLVVSEVARYGIPSVAYPVPGLKDSIINEETGLLSYDESPEALADCILKLLRDRELRERYGRAAARRLAQFSHERFAERFCRVIESYAKS